MGRHGWKLIKDSIANKTTGVKWNEEVIQMMETSWASVSWEKYKEEFNTEMQWTLVHGDFHTKNLMVNREDTSKDTTAIDWEIVGIGRGPTDLATLLVTGKSDLRK